MSDELVEPEVERAEAIVEAQSGGDIEGLERAASLWGDAWRELRKRWIFWIAAGVRTWLQNTLKFFSPSACACVIATAVGGVVVSKPIAKKTTCRSGIFRANASASIGE